MMAAGRVTVSVAGQAQKLFQPTASHRQMSPRVRTVVIIADEGNVGDVVIGPTPDTVAAAANRVGSWPLDAGQSITLEGLNGDLVDMSEWYVDVTTSGDSVRWIVSESDVAAEDITI